MFPALPGQPLPHVYEFIGVEVYADRNQARLSRPRAVHELYGGKARVAGDEGGIRVVHNAIIIPDERLQRASRGWYHDS